MIKKIKEKIKKGWEWTKRQWKKLLVILGIGVVLAAGITLQPEGIPNEMIFGSGETWYNASWSYRIKLDIDPAKVDADLTNFPVYVDLSDMPAAFFTNLNSDGSDIRVTTDDGITEVAREVVFASTTAQTGELHFNATGTLSSTATTTFYIYYGNSGASDYASTSTYGRNNIWTNNYRLVWHLQEAVNNNADGYIDSSGNGLHGTGASMALAAVNGQLAGKGQDFDGTADLISDNTSATTGSDAAGTISMWFKRVATGTSEAIFHYGIKDSNDSLILFRLDQGATNNIEWLGKQGGTSIIRGTSSLANSADNTWKYLTYTNGTGGNAGYYNGANVAISYTTGTSTTDFWADDITGENQFSIGGGAAGMWYGPGQIDEVRLSSVAKTPTWISTEYNNQSSPSTFYAVGAEEESGAVARRIIIVE